MATCFVIMPVTTPDSFLSTYNNDGAHFHHVLEHLFRPALEQLDFEVIPPTATGADLIQAQIIENLETADLVLCDMSTLNANVFFELGIRTALNRPVCMVKDDATERVPFDTGIINFHTYLSELAPWTLENQVQQLKGHINDSVEGSNGSNALWRYFGLTAVAAPPVEETGLDAKVDRLTLQFEALNRRLENPTPSRFLSVHERAASEPQSGQYIKDMISLSERLGVRLFTGSIDAANPSAVTLQFEPGKLTDELRRQFSTRAVLAGIDLEIDG